MNIGQIGEELVAGKYINKGYAVVDRNIMLHASKQIGEIDIVAIKKNEVVFVEVKTRRNFKYGSPLESISYLKKRRLVNACQVYLLRHPQYDNWNWRIDVAEVYLDKNQKSIIIWENAIEDY